MYEYQIIICDTQASLIFFNQHDTRAVSITISKFSASDRSVPFSKGHNPKQHRSCWLLFCLLTMASNLQEQLDIALSENNELKESLRRSQLAYQDLQQDANFSRAKAAELREIVETKNPDEIHEKLIMKSLHNAELSLEVDKLYLQLQQTTADLEKLGQEREANKTMLLSLSDIVRTLQSVSIDYDQVNRIESLLRPQDMSLQNIKRKVEAIMADRERLMQKCENLTEENESKEDKISALEAQFQMINSIEIARHEDTDDGTLSDDSRSVTKNRNVETLSCSSETASSSGVFSVPAQNISTFDDSEREEAERLKFQLVEASRRYDCLRHECQKVLTRMATVEREVTKAKKEVEGTRKKRDEYRNNLRDVIEQYKKLNTEYDEAMTHAKAMEEKIKTLEGANDKLEEEKNCLVDCLVQESTRKQEEIEAWKPVHCDKEHDYEELKRAYRMALAKISIVQRKLQVAQRELDLTLVKKETRDRQLRDSVAQHHKLEQEHASLLQHMTGVEKESGMAKKEAQRHKEEAKHTRRRLAGCLGQVKRLEQEQEITLATITGMKVKEQKARNEEGWTNDFMHKLLVVEASTKGQTWQAKKEFLTEKRRLVKANMEMKRYCEDMLKDFEIQEVGKTTIPRMISVM
jgi:chromosome segregation ATPase